MMSFDSYHTHHTEDHAHEHHNFKTHDSSHSASTAHLDHGLNVVDTHNSAVVDHGYIAMIYDDYLIPIPLVS